MLTCALQASNASFRLVKLLWLPYHAAQGILTLAQPQGHHASKDAICCKHVISASIQVAAILTLPHTTHHHIFGLVNGANA